MSHFRGRRRGKLANKNRCNACAINARFRAVREKVEGPRGRLRFAKAIDESHSNVSRYERGRKIPGHVLARVVKRYGVNANWLLTGDGVMFSPTEADNIRRLELKLPVDTEQESEGGGRTDEFVILPVLRNVSVLTPGRRVTDADVERSVVLHRAWCPHPNRTDCVRITDDAMAPAIPENAVVAVDKTYAGAEKLDGRIAAIYVASATEVIIRWIRKDAGRSRQYIALADNSDTRARPVLLGPDDRVIGRVVAVLAAVV